MNSFLGKTELSRGLRNNNPGNLQKTAIAWMGKIPLAKNTDSRFEQFTFIEYGIRAMAIDLIGDIAKDGKNTLNKLVQEYAPSFENDTNAYITAVSKATGLKPNDKIPLSLTFLHKLIKAKLDVENGKQGKLVTDAMVQDGINLINETAKKLIANYK